MKHTAVLSRVLLSFVFSLLAARIATGSASPPLTLEALATVSDAIVIGHVQSIATGRDPATGGIYTYVTLDPSEILKGQLGDGFIVIKQLGGELGDQGVRVPGQARFGVGEEVLVFLEARPRDRSLYTIGLWRGKWTIETDVATNERLAVNREADTGLTVGVRVLSSLRAELARPVPLGPTTAALNVAPAEHPGQSLPYVLNNPPIRWFVPVVSVHVETGTQPGLNGGGLAEIVAGIAQWNAAASALTLAGSTARLPPRCLAAGAGVAAILITFNDPCLEISSDDGLLAIAQFAYSLSGGQTINGQFFFPMTEAIITTSRNVNATPFLVNSPCFQSTLTHEIGHAIGFDHTPDPTALMYFAETGACFQGPLPLATDDLLGLFAMYPTAGGPPPGTTLPGTAPTGLAVQVNGVTSISVSFNAVSAYSSSAQPSAATSYLLEFRQVINGPILASVPTTTTTTVIPLPPGIAGTFNVTVAGINGAGRGPTSAAVQFVIGGGPPPPPGPGPCTSPPASPVVSGSIVAGTATVSWSAVAGATSYILSAGSTQGASNIFPSTNIGPTTSASASGLPAGFSAWVRVIAVNACGPSAPTDFFLSSGPAPPPPPPPGGNTFLQFTTSSNACGCWIGTISLQIDGATVGSMSCTESRTFPVTPGSHLGNACDSLGCASTNINVSSGSTSTIELFCNLSTGGRSIQPPF